MHTLVLPPVAAPSLASEAHRANTRAQALVVALELTAAALRADGLHQHAADTIARMRHAMGKAGA